MIRYGRPERGDRALRRGRPCSTSSAGRLLRRGEGQDLDLVELVGAQHAPRVAARPSRPRAGSTACAPSSASAARPRRGSRRRRSTSAAPRPSGCTTGRRARWRTRRRRTWAADRWPSASPSSRATAGGSPRRRRRCGRARAGTAPGPASRRPALHREHRAADLGGPLVVEDAERGRRLPVRHALVVGERLGQAIGPLTTGLSASLSAVGRVGVGQVGDPQQQLAQRWPTLVVLVGQLLLGVAELRGSRPGSASASSMSPSRRSCADLLRQLVDPRPACRRAAPSGRAVGRRARPLVELLEERRIAAAGSSPCAPPRGRCAAAGRRSRRRKLPALRSAGRVRFAGGWLAGELLGHVVVGQRILVVADDLGRRHRGDRGRYWCSSR